MHKFSGMIAKTNRLYFILSFLLLSCGSGQEATVRFMETQLTSAPYGHTIHVTQAFSKDGKWIVYDTRNDDTKIGSTGRIEMVNTKTGETKLLYETSNQTVYGPGVGAVTFSPVQDSVLFIHGIRNANERNPYGVTRRTGVAVNINDPQQPIFMDARDITAPFTVGALRGGTHAHSWSADGRWISFTYNDYIMEQLAKSDTTKKDLRMVGVMVPGQVAVGTDSSRENNSGEMFAAVVTAVTESPQPGSDEIDKAFDEGWIGTNGYVRADGSRQKRAIAFQGNTRNDSGKTTTEVYVVDLPDDIRKARAGEYLQGTLNSRPSVPAGVVQRRITHTAKGIQGPRHWLRSTPDGGQLFFLSTDEAGIVQLFAVSPNGGDIRQVTHHTFSVQGAFNVNPAGNLIAYPADNSIFVTDIASGKAYRVTERFSDDEKIVSAPNWSPDGKSIAYIRYVKKDEGNFLQIFLLKRVDAGS